MRFGELKRGLTLVLLMKRGLPRSKKKKKMMMKRGLTLVLLMKSGLKLVCPKKVCVRQSSPRPYRSRGAFKDSLVRGVSLNWYVQRKCVSGKVPLDPIDQGGPSKIQAKIEKKKKNNANK